MTKDIEIINEKLDHIYGRSSICNKPFYRVVWSNDQLEKRFGEFTDYFGDIKLRTVAEVREVQKYPADQDKWVFEFLQNAAANKELTEDFSYEPLWIFGNGNSHPYPSWDKVVVLVQMHAFAQRQRLTQKDADINDRLWFEKEKARFRQILDDTSPDIAGAVNAGEGIFVPSNYNKKAE